MARGELTSRRQSTRIHKSSVGALGTARRPSGAPAWLVRGPINIRDLRRARNGAQGWAKTSAAAVLERRPPRSATPSAEWWVPDRMTPHVAGQHTARCRSEFGGRERDRRAGMAHARAAHATATALQHEVFQDTPTRSARGSRGPYAGRHSYSNTGLGRARLRRPCSRRPPIRRRARSCSTARQEQPPVTIATAAHRGRSLHGSGW